MKIAQNRIDFSWHRYCFYLENYFSCNITFTRRLIFPEEKLQIKPKSISIKTATHSSLPEINGVNNI